MAIRITSKFARKLLLFLGIVCLVVYIPMILGIFFVLQDLTTLPLEYDYWNCNSDFETVQYCNAEQNNGMPFCSHSSSSSMNTLSCLATTFIFESESVGVLTITPAIPLIPLDFIIKSITLNGFAVENRQPVHNTLNTLDHENIGENIGENFKQEILMIIGDNITNITALGQYGPTELTFDMAVLHKTSISIHVLSPSTPLNSTIQITIAYVTAEYSHTAIFVIALFSGLMLVAMVFCVVFIIAMAIEMRKQRQQSQYRQISSFLH